MNVRIVALIRAVSIMAALGTTACNRYAALPPGTPTPVVGQNSTVAGTVWLHDTGGAKPDANVQLSVWVQTASLGQRVATSAGPDGRYSLTVPTGALVRFEVSAAYQPCVTAIGASGNTNLDVHLIVDPAQLGAHLPSELLAYTPTLSGKVFETTALGRQPVPGVLVAVDMLGGLGDVSATTLTDSDGGYVLCGLGGVASSPYVYAFKFGYQIADVGTVIVNSNTIRDIELQR